MMHDEMKPSVFLSHHSGDKDYVRRLAAAMTVTGATLWFDEWMIRPGDSIPAAIDAGLATFNTFVLVWSEAASKSRWVESEMQSAIMRWTADESLRLVPVRLDSTPLPTLLAPLRSVDGRDRDYHRVARELLGIESENAYRIAVQGFIDEAGLDFIDDPGSGLHVACRKCGATVDHLSCWEQTDYERDDRYAGVHCDICGWEDGGEI